MRIGHGFDVHAFGGEGPIIIGGVRIPYEKGLLAHSDGDVALHALTDALLGAAALGDIGKLFPDTDPAFKGADSRELLREAWRRIQAKGYTLGNVDVTIIAQAPKMLPHIPQMRVFIAEDLGCHMDDVNVKATTTEKLGFTGRGEGIACEALAFEQAAVAAETELQALLVREKVEAARRAMLLYPQQLSWNWWDDVTVEIRFWLPAGSFATSVVRELINTTGDYAHIAE